MSIHENNAWVCGLPEKRQEEFFNLRDEEQALIIGRREQTRYTALRHLDHLRRGINSRNHWVEGVEQLQALVRNPYQPFTLSFDGKILEIEALIDILIDFRQGLHNNTKNTDPMLYRLIQDGNGIWQRLGYDKKNFMGLAKYFQDHPEARPFPGRYPSVKEMAEKAALRAGARMKRLRKQAGMSVRQLAKEVETCEKTIKNMEAGKPVSSHTFLMARNIIDATGKNLKAGDNTRREKIKP